MNKIPRNAFHARLILLFTYVNRESLFPMLLWRASPCYISLEVDNSGVNRSDEEVQKDQLNRQTFQILMKE